MSRFGGWSDEFRGVWEGLPGIPLFRDFEREQAEGMFYSAFVDKSLTKEERDEAREEFFDYTGLPEEMFPWDEWREAMGYGDN